MKYTSSSRAFAHIAAFHPELTALRRDLHAHPELGFEEVYTAHRVQQALTVCGVDEIHTGIGKTGVVAVIKGKRNGSGRMTGLRADMDALPMAEHNDFAWKSEKPGLMHGCGHDGHTAMLVGAARYLAETRNFDGTAVLIFQPGEEGYAGAQAMIDDGLFTRFPRPDCALTLHVAPSLAAGTVGYREGLFWAGCASLDLLIRGIGGHGSRPHETRDPVVMAAETILLLQTIVSRETDPSETAVLTVGSIHGGSKGNIIPEEVLLQVNYRYFSTETDRLLRAAIERTARGVALAAGVPEDRMPIVTDQYTGPPVYNDPALTRRVADALRRVLGEECHARAAWIERSVRCIHRS